MTCDEIFSLNLKLIMESKGLTTNGLAKDTGIPQKTIWTMMNNTNSPSLKTMEKICTALKVCPGWMISEPPHVHPYVFIEGERLDG